MEISEGSEGGEAARPRLTSSLARAPECRVLYLERPFSSLLTRCALYAHDEHSHSAALVRIDWPSHLFLPSVLMTGCHSCQLSGSVFGRWLSRLACQHVAPP